MSEERPRIETRTIDVLVVRVGERQMTQSVFRQIRRAPAFHLETGKPVDGAELWGTVNYWPSSEAHGRANILWQRGAELRRWAAPDFSDTFNPANAPWKIRKTVFADKPEYMWTREEKQRALLLLIDYKRWFLNSVMTLPQLFIAV